MPRDDREESDSGYLERVHAELTRLLRGRSSLAAALDFLDSESAHAAQHGPTVQSHVAFNAGVLAHAANDPTGALKRLELSISLEPTNPQYLLATVFPLLDLGRVDDALAACRQAQRLISEDAFWQFLESQSVGYEGAVLVAGGHAEEALQLLDSLSARIAAYSTTTRWCDLQLVHALAEAEMARERCVAYVQAVVSRAALLNDRDLLQRVAPLQCRLTS